MTVVAGFDAFGKLPYNPSQHLVEELAPDLTDQVQTLILPTSYGRAWEELRRAMDHLPTRSLVLFGYARRASGLRLERFGRNRDTAKTPDNDGVVRAGEIISRAPDRLPVIDAVNAYRRLRAAELPTTLSNNAGGFVCNHVLFRALWESARLAGPSLILFAHVADWERSPDPDAILRAARLLVSSVTGLVTNEPNRPVQESD